MKRIFILVFLLAIFPKLLSQVTPVRFKRLTVQDGLSRSWVKCFLQDKTGYVWVGTADGLNKYDGISFKTYKYDSKNPHSLDHNNTNVLFEDSKGKIWIGSQSGLNLYDREKDEIVPVSGIKNFIKRIIELENGQFLVGTSGGLFIFNPMDLTYRQIYTDLAIEDMLMDKHHNFWLATFKGLLLLDLSDFSYTIVHSPDYEAISKNIIRSLFQDYQGRIWIGTNSDGLFLLEYPQDSPQHATFVNYKFDSNDPHSINQGSIYAINEDEDSNLWVGIENGGINILDLKKMSRGNRNFEHLYHNPVDGSTLSNNSIYSIYRDRQNTMWIGTYAGGISFYNKLLNKFEHHKQNPGSNLTISNNHVNVIYEEEKYLWIGTEGGLNCYDKAKKTFSYFKHDFRDPHSVGSNPIWSIYRDSRNQLWIGTWDGGLNLFDEKKKNFTHFYFNNMDSTSIGGNNIFDIIEDKNGNLWFALMGGGVSLYDYKTRTFHRFREDFNANSISCDWANAIIESSDGNIWISTTEAVDLYIKKLNHFTSFVNIPSKRNSISYNGGTSLFEDSRKNIWIATSNGLNLFIKSDSSFKCYQEKDGIANNSIKAICEDDHGNLWFSTSTGITKFIDGVNVPEKPVFKNYSVHDDMQGNEFTNRAVFRNREGYFYFGSTNGYYVFHPDKIRENPYIPNIVFTDLLIYNKPVRIDDENSPLKKNISITRELKLSRKYSVFTIEFASLSLLAPENNQYAFILEGFEKEWNYVGHQRSATYTNLDPGKYTFRVKASNNDGLWNEEGTSLEIIILPAWWQTWIARGIYILIILLASYFFRKHTIISINLKKELWMEHLEKKKTEELNQLKNQFFTNVSHELRTPLTLIIGPLKKLITETENPAPLQTIYRNAARLKILVDQIMDFSKIESHMMKLNFVRKDIMTHIVVCHDNFKEYSRHKNIALILKSQITKCVADFDEDKIDKILANIISNAVKNTPEGGCVTTLIDYEKQTSLLKIDISDNGRGIMPDEVEHIFDRFFTSQSQSAENTGTGIGLDLTRKLIELQKGSITVSSIIGQGSTFSIQIPVKVFEVEFHPVEKILTKIEGKSNEKIKIPVVSEFKHGKTILIIDDYPEMCDFIESILSDEYNIIKENNSDESMNHVVNYLPDLIISDVMMPGLNGFELCKLLKSDLRFSHIPIILLTAKVAVHDHITGYETGADD